MPRGLKYVRGIGNYEYNMKGTCKKTARRLFGDEGKSVFILVGAKKCTTLVLHQVYFRHSAPFRVAVTPTTFDFTLTFFSKISPPMKGISIPDLRFQSRVLQEFISISLTDTIAFNAQQTFFMLPADKGASIIRKKRQSAGNNDFISNHFLLANTLFRYFREYTACEDCFFFFFIHLESNGGIE